MIAPRQYEGAVPKLKLLLAFLAILLPMQPLRANVVTELSFAQKMEQADLVVVARVDQHSRTANRNFSLATVTVVATLKGNSGSRLTISLYHANLEYGSLCCSVGSTYLMFLQRGPNGMFAPVNDRFGTVRVG